MKVGFFCAKFPYSNIDIQHERYFCGGSILAAHDLAIHIAKRGIDTYVFTTSIDSTDTIEEYKNIKIFRYATNFRLLTANVSLGMFRKPVLHDVDIVHTHFDIPPAPLAGLKYAKKKRKPLIVTYHGDWDDSYGNLIRRLSVYIHNKFIVDKILSYADVIISPSEFYIYESKFLRKYIDQIIVIPNGIDLERFEVPYSKEECREKLGLPLDVSIILFVGALTQRKGPDILIRAMHKIVNEIPDVVLVFVGSGEMRLPLEKLVDKLNLRKNVKFAGFVDESLKLLYYKAADVFCLPSTISTEVFPLVLLEASAVGLPLVVSNLNTFKCIVEEGYNGLFTRRGDEHSLAEAIIYLLTNEDEREKMAKNAKEKVKHYSWDNIAALTEKLYKKVLNNEDLSNW